MQRNNTIYKVHFAGNQLITVQDLDDIKYLTKTLTEEYKKWGLEINLDTKYYVCTGHQQSRLITGRR
jgi:hypothetical protein